MAVQKKVLVTGGAGFLGINLIRYLLGKGVKDIVSLDIADFNYPERNKVKHIKGDIRDNDIVSKAMEGVGCVVHAAAALPLYKKEDIYSTDVDGTRVLLEEAEKKKVERFVFISSTAVYGVPKKHPIYETDKLSGEIGHYARAKILAETICEEFRAKGMCVPILRPKSFIGPERLGAFSILFDWARSGKNFPIIGSGKRLFQLMDVEDLSQAIYLCLTKDRMTVNDIFNVGAKEFGTMKEDFQAVLDYAGFGGKVICMPEWLAVPSLKLLEFFHLSPIYKWIYETAGKESFVSIEKTEKTLGFRPKYSNEEALIRNYKWYLRDLKSFEKKSGISHRTPWQQGALKLLKVFF